MQTPAGKECKFYYEDYFRGREVQECRIPKGERSAPWRPQDCAKCPVPDILRANASPNLQLELTIKPTMLGFGRKMHVRASCKLHDIPVPDPYVGCPKCNEERAGLKLFAEALGNSEDSDD
ncbi:MAG: hypothetical protein GYB66_13465 [Chloroflexi bacterium]|nr:hypothetical protein [Chloroflexota bacterium]